MILQGDCLDVLKTLDDASVQCIVTSPPYYGLRDYGVAGQIGLESTPDEYVAKLVAVFRECRRVLKPDGTLWLNIADSYAGSGKGGQSEEKRSDNWQPEYANKGMLYGLKPKDLIGIPWMVAFALRADGWYLRSEIIWHKPNPMPESVKDRCTKSHEYIFLLSKSQKYYYDYEAILEPAAFDGRNDTQYKGGDKDVSCGAHERWPVKMPPIGGVKKANGQNRTYSGNTPDYQKMGLNGSGFNGHSGNLDENGESLLYDKDGIPARNKRDVWTVTTKPYKEAHFATFPPDLIEPCILAGTSEKGECPKCGKAWIRVVNREKPPAEVFTKNGKPDDIAAISHPELGKVGMGQKLQDWYIEHPPKMIGWQPQCECGLEPIPQTVLDPFNGSGTTGSVAIKHGRSYIGIELNPKYITLTEKRLSQVQPVML